MNLNIKSTKDIEEVAEFVGSSINKELNLGRNVIWFVSGGSAVPLEVLISRKINETNVSKLVVTLIDERYGPVDHIDSNWLKLKEAGFGIKGAKLLPFLLGKDFKDTKEDIIEMLKEELKKSDYKIGIFGIGIDGHTAGILPHTLAIDESGLICAYKTESFDRITITKTVIEMLDEAIVYAIGESKWPVIEKLKEDIPIDEQPAQMLKKVPLLTIFTDYNLN